jgi:hypothetical protein
VVFGLPGTQCDAAKSNRSTPALTAAATVSKGLLEITLTRSISIFLVAAFSFFFF